MDDGGTVDGAPGEDRAGGGLPHRGSPGAGYDAGFLGVPAALPTTPAPVVELAYTHFTVQLDPQRRLARATAVNVDGAALREVARVDVWAFDPRVPETAQAGDELYAGNDLDRGHLVRRRDPVWGSERVATQANVDSFVFPNAAPQVSVFNQSKELWNGLEDHVLEHARGSRRRLSVLTGPVLVADDPVYRGVQLPRRFWKVVGWAAPAGEGASATLAATAYVLDQTELLGRLRLSASESVPRAPDRERGALRTVQVPVAGVAELTGLGLDAWIAADRLPPAAAAESGDPVAWRLLRAADDIELGEDPGSA